MLFLVSNFGNMFKEKIKGLYKGEHKGLVWWITVTTVLVFISFLVGPGNTVWDWREARKEAARQEKQMEELLHQIETMDASITDRESVRDSLEKFAREQYGFAAPGEDVYVME